MAERITIIHGPNGFGKTTLLRMLNAFFSGHIRELAATPFDEFIVEFDDGQSLLLTGAPPDQAQLEFENLRSGGSERPRRLVARLLRGGAVVDDSPVGMIAKKRNFPASSIERFFPFLERVGSRMWRNRETGEFLSLEAIVDRFPVPFQGFDADLEKPWLKDLRGQVQVLFIESQRLLKPGMSHQGEEQKLEPAVDRYARELADKIRTNLAHYGALSQSLDRTFPMRLIQELRSEESPEGSVSVEALQKKLAQLEERRAWLREAGLLDKEDDAQYELPEQLESGTKRVLAVYVRDVEKKLSVFDRIAERIDLMKQIVNEHFLFKRMLVSKDKGFTFLTDADKVLSASSLSTGEQHELVLLSELLFSTDPRTLVLIDEPEISLHVAWQEQFLRDLQTITRLTSMDVLIATHSPQIIFDRWDLTVELVSPKGVR